MDSYLFLLTFWVRLMRFSQASKHLRYFITHDLKELLRSIE